MYLVDTEVDVRWQLLPSNAAVPRTAFSIVVKSPDDTATVVNEAFTESLFAPYTTTTPGLGVFKFTPDEPGMWNLTLVAGEGVLATPLANIDMYVFSKRILLAPISLAVEVPAVLVYLSQAMYMRPTP